MSSYFRYPVQYGGSYSLTKNDAVYIITVDGASIVLPNPEDNNLIGKRYEIKVSVSPYTTPINISVASGSGNTLIDNSLSTYQITNGTGCASFICSPSPNGNVWFVI